MMDFHRRLYYTQRRAAHATPSSRPIYADRYISHNHPHTHHQTSSRARGEHAQCPLHSRARRHWHMHVTPLPQVRPERELGRQRPGPALRIGAAGGPRAASQRLSARRPHGAQSTATRHGMDDSSHARHPRLHWQHKMSMMRRPGDRSALPTRQEPERGAPVAATRLPAVPARPPGDGPRSHRASTPQQRPIIINTSSAQDRSESLGEARSDGERRALHVMWVAAHPTPRGGGRHRIHKPLRRGRGAPRLAATRRAATGRVA